MGRSGPCILTKLFFGMVLLAFLLAAAGLYGVLAFGVKQRTREIGIRRTVGAGRREIVAVVSRRALWQVGAGLLIGLGLGLPWRSEEHTSELQSLMRISYDVCCLKKKKNREC